MCWRASMFGLSAWALVGAAAHATPLPIQAFFAPPVARGAQLSPSGHYLAVITHPGTVDVVSIIDLAAHERSTALTAKDARIGWVRWKGDDRLVAGLTPWNAHAGAASDGEEPEPGRPGEVLTALDRDGRQAVTLSAGRPGGAAEALRMADPLSRDPAHVLVVAPDAKGAPSLWKVDVRSGRAEFVREGDDDPDDRVPGGAMIVRYDHKPPADADFDVLGPIDGGKRAYVALQPRTTADGDTSTVRIYDFDRGSFSAPVWPASKYDVSDVVYHDGDSALAGVCYTADAYVCNFANAPLEADYRRAAAAVGPGHSLTPLSMSDDGRYWLLGVSAPNQPGAYYVFDRTTKRMTLALDRHPDLPAARLGTMTTFDYVARDGTRIPGYVTRPPGVHTGALPMIVLPHGGPEARDTLGFDVWAQFFATRGYLVFQPNFRGSSGYGRRWVEAGYGQWGGRMQNDLTDGVRALIADGRVDPKRICIFGASYGGYAALYGGAKTPELYKCVASFAGVSDLRALVRWEHSTKGHEARYRYAERAIGDPVKDAARLKAASPTTYASSYQLPVLLIHGSKDASSPLAQSQMMARALKRAGKDVKLTVYEGEGHSDWSRSDEEAALTEVADFVASHIAPAATGS